jgi:hypothetical protein
LTELRESGVSDFSAYLSQHPRQVHHCWSLIKAVDHNQAFLELMGVADSEGPTVALLFRPTQPGFLEDGPGDHPGGGRGDTTVEREETLVTTTGEPQNRFGKIIGRFRPRGYPGTRGDCPFGYLKT